MEDNIILRSKEFEGNVLSNWRQFRSESIFCDITLACDGRQMQAHKLVLSSSSSVLCSLLADIHHQHPILYLRGVKYHQLVNLIDFVYLGETNVDKNSLKDFLAIAQDLGIKGLCEENDVEGGDVKLEEEVVDLEPITTINVKENEALESLDSLGHSAGVRFDAYDSGPEIQDQIVMNDYEFNTMIPEIEKSYACDQCDYKAARKDHLRTHRNAIHAGIYYYCEQCDYRASQKGNLKVHVNSVHIGVSYPCDQCSYKATRKAHLQRHVETIHKGIYYYCEQCDYKTGQKCNLRVHVMTKHEGITFECAYCDYQTNLGNGKLNRHIKQRHGEFLQ